MKIFLNTDDILEIESCSSFLGLDGVYINTKNIKKSHYKDLIKNISNKTAGTVFAYVFASSYDKIIEEGTAISEINKNVCITLPMMPSAIKAVEHFASKSIQVNITSIFTAAQGILAAKAGANFITPMFNKADEYGINAAELAKDLRMIVDNYIDFSTQINFSSVKTQQQASYLAKFGIDCITITPALFKQLYKHPYTDKSIGFYIDRYENS